MPVYQLGNGNGYFNSASQPDWTNDSAVFSGNGDSTIIARAIMLDKPTSVPGITDLIATS